MRMELIQPFINAADAVFAESLQGPTKIVDVEMDENAYRRKGVAALILIKGDIEGRVILDLSPEVAVKVASVLAGTEMEASEQVVRETVCELANMICGSVLSRVEKNATFRLATPRLVPPGKKQDGFPTDGGPSFATSHAAGMGTGRLMAYFQTDIPAWSATEKHAS